MPADSENVHAAESDDVLWSAVQRTWREAAPLPDDDVRVLVARSMEAYWSHRREEVSREVATETAAQARRIAERFRDPIHEFWLEAGLAVAPLALIPLVLKFEQRAQFLLPGWSPYLLSLLILAIAGASYLWIRSSWRPSPDWGWLRSSAGAFAGGLIVVSLLGPHLFNQDRDTVNAYLTLAQERVVRLALSSLKSRQEGSFLSAHEHGELVSVSTTQLSPEMAVYKASPAEGPGEVVASLAPESGKVSWTVGGHEEERGRFVVGAITHVDSRFLTVRTSQGEMLKLILASLPGSADLLSISKSPQDAVGRQVIVAFDPGTKQILATTLVHEARAPQAHPPEKP